MKLVTTKFKSGGLREKDVVATWNLGNHLSITLKKQYKNEIQTIQNTINTNSRTTKTHTHTIIRTPTPINLKFLLIGVFLTTPLVGIKVRLITWNTIKFNCFYTLTTILVITGRPTETSNIWRQHTRYFRWRSPCNQKTKLLICKSIHSHPLVLIQHPSRTSSCSKARYKPSDPDRGGLLRERDWTGSWSMILRVWFMWRHA